MQNELGKWIDEIQAKQADIAKQFADFADGIVQSLLTMLEAEGVKVDRAALNQGQLDKPLVRLRTPYVGGGASHGVSINVPVVVGESGPEWVKARRRFEA